MKSPNYFNTKVITSIYIDVKREITDFNNDLKQVSRKLSIVFSRSVILYTAYLTWKKYSEISLQEANKPYQNMLSTRGDKLNFFLKMTSNNDNITS